MNTYILYICPEQELRWIRVIFGNSNVSLAKPLHSHFSYPALSHAWAFQVNRSPSREHFQFHSRSQDSPVCVEAKLRSFCVCRLFRAVRVCRAWDTVKLPAAAAQKQRDWWISLYLCYVLMGGELFDSPSNREKVNAPVALRS